MDKLRLNLGCSDDLKPGHVNVDRHSDCPRQMPLEVCTGKWLGGDGTFAPIDYKYRDDYVYTANLTEPWPLKDSTVDAIYAKDVFEHIDNAAYPGNRGKIWVLNESYRVLKPNGILEFLVPCAHLRDGRVNPGAFADPTHASFWTHDDRYYFCEEWNNQQGERGRLGLSYGIRCLFEHRGDGLKWDLEEYGLPHERRSKVHAVLRAVK